MIKFTSWLFKILGYGAWVICHLYFYDTKRWFCILFKPLVLIHCNCMEQSNQYIQWSIFLLCSTEESPIWNNLRLSNKWIFFFGGVKSIYYDNNNGWIHNHTHSHTPLQPLCQRETTLFYLWLMRNTKHPLAFFRHLGLLI